MRYGLPRAREGVHIGPDISPKAMNKAETSPLFPVCPQPPTPEAGPASLADSGHTPTYAQDGCRRIDRALGPMAAEGFRLGSLGYLHCIRRHVIKNMALPRAACVFILEGSKAVHRDDAREVVHAGRLSLIPARWPITIENIPDASSGRYRALCLSFEHDIVARVAAASPADPSNRHLRDMWLTPSALLVDALLHLLAIAKAHPGVSRLTEVGLEQFLLLLAAEGGGLLLQSELPLLDRISSLVLADTARRWDAVGIAQALCLGERTLRRRLENAGASLRDIVREARLHAALALLQQSDLCAGEVARRCGYDSASRFTQRFREKFGLLPSDVIRARASRDKD